MTPETRERLLQLWRDEPKWQPKDGESRLVWRIIAMSIAGPDMWGWVWRQEMPLDEHGYCEVRESDVSDDAAELICIGHMVKVLTERRSLVVGQHDHCCLLDALISAANAAKA